jgi:hypothetical protein
MSTCPRVGVGDIIKQLDLTYGRFIFLVVKEVKEPTSYFYSRTEVDFYAEYTSELHKDANGKPVRAVRGFKYQDYGKTWEEV